MPLLEVERLHARYDYAPVLQGVSFTVDAGEIVSVFGRNGAGKTTTLRTLMGWLRPSEGTIRFGGDTIGGLSPDRIFRRGVAFIPEDRRIFADAQRRGESDAGAVQPMADRRRSPAGAISTESSQLFPRLGERRRQLGKTLSGGEQQMLAIGRALIGEPKLLLVDEPSEGLAPIIVNEIFESLTLMRDEGIALLLVEQNVRRAAAISDCCYVMEKGRIVIHGVPSVVLADETVRQRLSV